MSKNSLQCNRYRSILAILLVGTILVVLLASPLRAVAAERLDGADDSAFVNAVDAWLNDNDSDSLSALSGLANKGSLAARILLSRIELTDRASTNVVRALSRSELLDLFRPKQSDTPFRPSWLKIETERNNQFARVLFQATSYGINLAAIERLHKISEVQAAEHLIRKVAVDGTRNEQNELLEFLDSRSELYPYVRGFRDASKGITTAHTALQHIVGYTNTVSPESIELIRDAETNHAMQFVDIGYQANDNIIQYNSNNKFYNTITEWIMSAPESRGIAKLCRQSCEESGIPACANTALGLIGGYYEVIRFDSPLESVIPQANYLDSKRNSGMTLRRIAAVRTDSHQKIFSDRELADKSQCLADAVNNLH